MRKHADEGGFFLISSWFMMFGKEHKCHGYHQHHLFKGQRTLSPPNPHSHIQGVRHYPSEFKVQVYEETENFFYQLRELLGYIF